MPLFWPFGTFNFHSGATSCYIEMLSLSFESVSFYRFMGGLVVSFGVIPKFDLISYVCAEERLTFVGEDDIEIEMRVPQEAVKLIIGRQGANIKQVNVQAGNWLSQGLSLLFDLFPPPPHPTEPTLTMYIFQRNT